MARNVDLTPDKVWETIEANGPVDALQLQAVMGVTSGAQKGLVAQALRVLEDAGRIGWDCGWRVKEEVV